MKSLIAITHSHIAQIIVRLLYIHHPLSSEPFSSKLKSHSHFAPTLVRLLWTCNSERKVPLMNTSTTNQWLVHPPVGWWGHTGYEARVTIVQVIKWGSWNPLRSSSKPWQRWRRLTGSCLPSVDIISYHWPERMKRAMQWSSSTKKGGWSRECRRWSKALQLQRSRWFHLRWSVQSFQCHHQPVDWEVGKRRFVRVRCSPRSQELDRYEGVKRRLKWSIEKREQCQCRNRLHFLLRKAAPFPHSWSFLYYRWAPTCATDACIILNVHKMLTDFGWWMIFVWGACCHGGIWRALWRPKI